MTVVLEFWTGVASGVGALCVILIAYAIGRNSGYADGWNTHYRLSSAGRRHRE